MTIAEAETKAGEPWTEMLGDAPSDEGQRQMCLKQVRVIAAYRDRYGVTDSTPLGEAAGGANQRLDAERAPATVRN